MAITQKNKEQIVAFILEQQASSGNKRCISHTKFQNDLSMISAEIVSSVVKDLEAEGAVKVKREGMFIHPYKFSSVRMTLIGWQKYASSVLSINIQKDEIIVSEYIRTHSPVNISSINSDLDLSPLQIDFAIDHLESQGKVTCNRREHPLTLTWIGQ
ncbi:MAG: hypothetical protein R3C14_08855 [Caldilineaceae bacterium]